MVTTCPKCHETIRLSGEQSARVREALARLRPGQRLTLKCPHCKASFPLGPARADGPLVRPPGPPDIEWLRKGGFEEQERIEDVPMALILHPDRATAARLEERLGQVGYQVALAETAEEARERIRFVAFACVLMHTRFEGDDLSRSSFHRFMCRMGMERRRYIFYVLIGPELSTLYDLQALALSANLVVNEQDLDHLDVIFRKAIPAYEELFGPFIEELEAYGQR